ncbi:MAG: ribonuclease HII [Bacteroidales bacterium]|nr:ribonuclease HII [Bacteroidales bacterium]
MLKNFLIPGVYEAGCDEAGRGCLAGPVYAAAVILPDNYFHPLLNDSKKLTAKTRETVRKDIEKDAIAWAVAWVDNLRIDEINILRASIQAMHMALDKLSVRPGSIIVDGNRFMPYGQIPYRCMVKGDATYASIAAASVLAKTWRDACMMELHSQHGQYGWDRNKGYPTAAHRQAIMRYGITSYHRKTFTLFNQQLSYDFNQ